MRSKLAIPVLVAASLLGATTLAFAQMEPATRAPAESSANAMASMHHHHHWRHHHSGYTRRDMARSRPGGRPISRKPAD
jgi:hypothetical protein